MKLTAASGVIVAVNEAGVPSPTSGEPLMDTTGKKPGRGQIGRLAGPFEEQGGEESCADERALPEPTPIAHRTPSQVAPPRPPQRAPRLIVHLFAVGCGLVLERRVPGTGGTPAEVVRRAHHDHVGDLQRYVGEE